MPDKPDNDKRVTVAAPQPPAPAAYTPPREPLLTFSPPPAPQAFVGPRQCFWPDDQEE